MGKKNKKRGLLKTLLSGNTFAGNIMSGLVVAVLTNVIAKQFSSGATSRERFVGQGKKQ